MSVFRSPSAGMNRVPAALGLLGASRSRDASAAEAQTPTGKQRFARMFRRGRAAVVPAEVSAAAAWTPICPTDDNADDFKDVPSGLTASSDTARTTPGSPRRPCTTPTLSMDGLRRRLEGAALDEFIASTSRSWMAAPSSSDDSLDFGSFEMRATPTLPTPSTPQSAAGADPSLFMPSGPRGHSRPRARPPSMDELLRSQETRALVGFLERASRARP